VNGSEIVADEDGEVLADDGAAHDAAVETARELSDITRWNAGRIVVRDEDGRQVTEVELNKSF
jgi:hypothetical protein